MTALSQDDIIKRIEKAKLEVKKRNDEKQKWEVDLQAAKIQKAELEKEVKEKFKITLDDLDSEIENKKKEILKDLENVEKMLNPVSSEQTLKVVRRAAV
jgi:hypothetical protein